MFFLGNMHYESTILLTSVYGNIICESIRFTHGWLTFFYQADYTL